MNAHATPDLLARCARVRLAVFDVDGVMTDGRLILGGDGEELKAFHVRDGLGLKGLMRNGLTVAVITARRSGVVARRMAELGIERYVQGAENKAAALDALLTELGLDGDALAYMGDDLVDWPAMRRAGVKLCPADADPVIRARADYVTEARGGRGAVRETCELLLAGHGRLEAWRDTFA
ncbi:MAG: HAD hydrolase family protein [Wenzhouxiangellaceae bacterium]|nr:HAD hydrolase family protein [Wenzhouxiangellaceae bacterium]